MPVQLITAPLLEPITLQEAKAHLRVEHALDDATVNACILAARQHVEEICWRGVVSQTWELVLPCFPHECCQHGADWPSQAQESLPVERQGIGLPKGNLVAVASVKYLDANGTIVTLAGAEYLADNVECPGRIRLAYGKSWPSTRKQWDAVRIQYSVGWAVAAVPAPIKQALLLLVSQMYEHRTPEIVGSIVSPIRFAVDSLLAPYRLARM